MHPNPSTRNVVRLLLVAFTMLVLTANVSAEWNEKVLYSFQGGNDGLTPAGGVVFDKLGNLYGTTSAGGTVCPSPGCGIVFEVSPPNQKDGAWTESVIYAFKGVQGGLGDGFTPVGGLIIDQEGNLYGTTSLGGDGPCVLFGSPTGCGTVFKVAPPSQKGGKWTETILYNFQGGTDGYFSWGDLVLDSYGNLYGATQFGGGRGNICNLYFGGNCGTVFKLTPPTQKGGKWTEKILHSFAAGTDGANPNGYLALDGNGAVYGLTNAGGNQNCNYGSGQVGCGTAFKLNPPIKKGSSWTEAVIHRFGSTGSNDGGVPMAGVVLDVKGRLYGTTLNGGPQSGGIVFCLARPSTQSHSWRETILYGFNGKEGGFNPEGKVVLDGSGRLYGTTSVGHGGELRGSVFRLKPPQKNGGTWSVSYLHGFTGIPDGMFPAAAPIFDKAGPLYSTTQQGGTGACPGGCGTVFQVSP